MLQAIGWTAHCDTLNEAYKLWDFIVNITGSRARFTFRCIIFPTVAVVHGKFIPHECLIVKTLIQFDLMSRNYLFPPVVILTLPFYRVRTSTLHAVWKTGNIQTNGPPR